MGNSGRPSGSLRPHNSKCQPIQLQNNLHRKCYSAATLPVGLAPRRSSTLPVPNLYFRTLYCFFVIEHGRWRVLHFNATFHPTSDWIVQQLREAFPLPCPYRYVLFDHDSKFGSEVLQFLNSSALKVIRTSIQSPWQNGVAERWVGSVRRELFDHIIPLNEYHLRRLGRDYLAYYHQDRTHIGLNKNTPATRAVERRSRFHTRIVCSSRLGDLHHRYRWPEAA